MRGHLFSKVHKFLDPAKYSEKTLAVGKVIGKKTTGRVNVAVQLNRFNAHMNMVNFHIYKMFFKFKLTL